MQKSFKKAFYSLELPAAPHQLIDGHWALLRLRQAAILRKHAQNVLAVHALQKINKKISLPITNPK